MTEQEKANALDWLNDLANSPAEEWQLYYSWSETKINATNALALMKEQEAIIRCKDCKHFDCGRLYKCRIHGSLFQPKDENWFCADGERKDDLTKPSTPSATDYEI